ncbi:hypothetical protein ACFPTO_18580 [Paraburkholderia denitrificans]|uniref:DUF2059 domain-containing protein n=1 Tax=Paraburkholderia denitrificans TaxID=694025 RepID=A0ABW0JCA4_9BURK
MIFIAGLSVAQQAASQSSYADTPRLVHEVLIEKELLPNAKHSVRVNGQPSMRAESVAREKAVRVTEVGSADTDIQILKAERGADNAASAPSLKPGSPRPAGPRATASQIERLFAIHRSQTTKVPGIGARDDIDVCVERSLREVDPGNRAWNPNDPRWDTMRSVITQDCAAQSDLIKAKVAPVLTKAYLDALRRSYEAHLSSTEADNLIQFYESDTGHRYVVFQERLALAGGKGAARLFSGKAGADAQAASSDAMKARMQMLRLSTTFAMLIVATQDARRAGGDATGGPAIGMLMSVTAANQGEMLDQIRREYSPNLHDFAAFVESPAETDELRALYEATATAGTAAGKFAMELSPELNGNLKRWRDLYSSLPKDKVGTPAQ